MRPCVFIHTNQKQNLGALVSAYSVGRKSRHADRFDVRIIRAEDFPFLAAREGQRFLRGDEKRVWTMDDLQSFTPLRFLPPELMGYQGRALIIDPDIFAVGDVWELLDRDMQGKSVLARPRPNYNGNPNYIATSVMLLDCARLAHWHCERDFGELFEFKRDYLKWTQLGYEPPESLGTLEPGWNDFDHLDRNMILLQQVGAKLCREGAGHGLAVGDLLLRELQRTEFFQHVHHMVAEGIVRQDIVGTGDEDLLQGRLGHQRRSLRHLPDPLGQLLDLGALRRADEVPDLGIVGDHVGSTAAVGDHVVGAL